MHRENSIALLFYSQILSVPPYLASRFLGAFLEVYYGMWIVPAHFESAQLLFHASHQPRFMDILRRNILQLRDPFFDERPAWIMILALLYWIVDSNRIDTCSTRLHLELRVVDSGLVVQELSSQVINPFPPILIQVVAEKRDQHCAHAEVDPSRLGHAPHAGIHHGKPRPTLLPRTEFRRVALVRKQFISPVDTGMFVFAFHFKFLDEVTMPFESYKKGSERSFVRTIVLMVFDVLIGLFDAQIAPGEIRRNTTS